MKYILVLEYNRFGYDYERLIWKFDSSEYKLRSKQKMIFRYESEPLSNIKEPTDVKDVSVGC